MFQIIRIEEDKSERPVKGLAYKEEKTAKAVASYLEAHAYSGEAYRVEKVQG